MDNAAEHISSLHGDWLVIAPELIVGSMSRLSQKRVRLWSLVLDARYIPCQIVALSAESISLLVPPYRFDEACQELRHFEQENDQWPPEALPTRPMIENTLATLSVLILLATFHNITQFDTVQTGISMPDWVSIGNAQAAKILDGQWWRLVTALTLHADWAHLSSNLAIGGIFVIFLCRELGSGLAWSLLLGAGTLGNLVNAYMQPASHSSVGASTAVFGAVGILAALSLVRYRHNLLKRWIFPVAGALSLLALLGTEGKNTDLGAHLFGFVYGGFLGLITEYVIGRHGRPGWLLNATLALFSITVVVVAWWAALHN
jgi:membrane associated rhomboid family serine protease